VWPSGLGSLFSGPDLSGITEEPLRVSAVLHASQMELSEEGAEASATTVVTALRTVAFFSLNGPFFFALVDDVSLAPLFMGVVTNPAPDGTPMHNDEPDDNVTHNGTDAAGSEADHKEQKDDPDVAAVGVMQGDLGATDINSGPLVTPPGKLESMTGESCDQGKETCPNTIQPETKV